MKTIGRIMLFLCVAVLSAAHAQKLDPTIVTHGPWLMFPEPTAMTIGYTTPKGYGAGVEFREAGTQKWLQKWQTKSGQIMRHKPMHAVRLTNLKPNTKYEYRLLLMKPFKFGEWDVKKPICKDPQVIRFQQPDFFFQTYPDKASDMTFAITSDLQFGHGYKENILKNFYKNCNIKDARFFSILGDCHDSLNNFDYDFCASIFDPLTRLGVAANQPSVFTRGNHDWRGAESDLWCDYFPAPNNKSSYYAFTCGNVFFIVLDSGEDKPSLKATFHYTGLNVEEKDLAREQGEWLHKIVKTDAYKKATFRVVLCHTVIYSHNEQYMLDFLKTTCGDLFKKHDKNPPIHLWVAGHTHVYSRAMPGNNKTMVCVYPVPWDVFKGDDYDFPAVTLDGPGYGGMQVCLMKMKVSGNTMVCEVMEENGKVFDAFQINADKTFKDLRKPDYRGKDMPVLFKDPR